MTIDDEIPTVTLVRNTLGIQEAPPYLTEGIISHVSSGLLHEGRSQLERFCIGFPEAAVCVEKTWGESRPVTHAIDDHVFDTSVLGRSPRDPE